MCGRHYITKTSFSFSEPLSKEDNHTSFIENWNEIMSIKLP